VANSRGDFPAPQTHFHGLIAERSLPSVNSYLAKKFITDSEFESSPARIPVRCTIDLDYPTEQSPNCQESFPERNIQCPHPDPFTYANRPSTSSSCYTSSSEVRYRMDESTSYTRPFLQYRHSHVPCVVVGKECPVECDFRGQDKVQTSPTQLTSTDGCRAGNSARS